MSAAQNIDRASLIAAGWIPPSPQVSDYEAWRPALQTYYALKHGGRIKVSTPVDEADKRNIDVLAAVQPFMPELVTEIGADATPTPDASVTVDGEDASGASSPSWLEPLAEFIEQRKGSAFTTDEAIEAIGLEPTEENRDQLVAALRARSGLCSAIVRRPYHNTAEECWTAQDAA